MTMMAFSSDAILLDFPCFSWAWLPFWVCI